MYVHRRCDRISISPTKATRTEESITPVIKINKTSRGKFEINYAFNFVLVLKPLPCHILSFSLMLAAREDAPDSIEDLSDAVCLWYYWCFGIICLIHWPYFTKLSHTRRLVRERRKKSGFQNDIRLSEDKIHVKEPPDVFNRHHDVVNPNSLPFKAQSTKNCKLRAKQNL